MMEILIKGCSSADVTKPRQYLVRMYFLPEIKESVEYVKSHSSPELGPIIMMTPGSPACLEYECQLCLTHMPTFEAMVEHLCLTHDFQAIPEG